MVNRSLRAALLLLCSLAFMGAVLARPGIGATATPDARTVLGGGAGAVYAMTNEADGNDVVVYQRAPDGSLTQTDTVSTGGLGTGTALGSQGGLILDSAARWLFAVNAGSNDISQFSVQIDGSLALVDIQSSGGVKPISLTLHGRLLYVLNAGTDSITGFHAGSEGMSPLPGSTRPLSGTGTDPAQVSFNPAGNLLVVTEKATNIIDTYRVGSRGLANGPRTHPSEGVTPFGFAFEGRHLVVSEAFEGAPDASALSSYYAAPSGALSTRSSSVHDGQTAACWVVITGDGRFAYTTNTGSNNISSYAIRSDGSLSLHAPVAGETGAAPADAAVSAESDFLYALNGADGTISAFRVRPNGALVAMTGAGGLPAGSTAGLAAF